MFARELRTSSAGRCMLAAVILLLGGLVGFENLRAQEITGSISGTVHDPSGAVLPNATVVATRVESRSPFTTTTNDLGLYSFPTLPTGTYQLSVEAPGFRKYVGTGVALHVNERLALDVTMEVGPVTQQVEVRAQPYRVNTQSGEVGNLVNGDQVKDLPLNGRNFIALTTLVPGTAPGSAGGLDTFDVGLMGGASLAINGNASNANLWLVNGVNNLDIGSNRTLLVFPSVDAIEEFSILRNNYSAEFGFASGGIINVVTKSGTQKFHGSAFEFLRNDKLDAADFFLNTANEKKNKLRYNNFGWSLGGPFYIPHHYNTSKTKDFFFLTQEWRREIRGGTVSMTVPTSRQRLGILDPTCSNGSPAPCVPQPADPLEVLSYAPNVAPYCLSGVTAPCLPVPGGSPAPGTTPIQLDPNGVAEAARYPLPNLAGNPNLIASKPNTTRWREDLLRWDHYYTERTNLMLHYIQDSWARDNTALWGDAPHPTIASDWTQPSKSATMRLSHTWNDRMLSTFQFSYSDNLIDWVSAKSCPPSLCSRQSFTYKEIFPETNGQFPTMWGTGDGFSTLWHVPPYTNRTDILQFSGDFSYVFGKHALKAGGTAGWLRKPAPAVAWNPTAGEFYPGTLGDLLLGNLAEYDETETQAPVPTRWKNRAIYVQDTYKALSNLTFNLGLRWQVLGQPFSATDNISNFFPNLYDPAQAPTLDASGNIILGTGSPTNGIVTPKSPGAFSRSLTDNHYTDWEPRVGFAYDPFRKGKFVLRGGFGIYHTQDSVDHLVNIGGNPPFNQTDYLYGVTFSSIAPPGPGTAQGPVGLTALDRPRPNPASNQYSFGFQVAPLSNTTLELNYVGSHEVHLGRNRDINQVPPSDQLAVFNGAPPSLYRPYLGYSSITLNERAGFASYNSFQFFLNHRMSHGLQLQAAYTWSHSIANAMNEQNGAGAQPVQDAYHPEREKGWSNIDQPQALVINYIWAVPFFKGRTGVAGQVLDGWQLSGISSFTSGLPTPACLIGDRAGIGAFSGCERPDAVPGQSVNLPRGRRTVDRYFNTDAFQLQPGGTFGNAAINDIRLPGVNDWDFALYKNFRTPWFGGNQWSEKGQLQFRAEFFNVWNHTQFSGLATTFGVSSFGRVVSAAPPREIQFGMKLLW